jgi:hypothetical protein
MAKLVGAEACISFSGWAYCSTDEGVRRLELEFKGLEPHGGWVREIYRPKRPPAFAAKEYVRIL